MGYKSISELLNPRTQARSQDISTFTKYEKGLITVEEAIKQFKRNNKINKTVKIDEKEFIEFLNGIGYKQII